jgi:hypothetical protein
MNSIRFPKPGDVSFPNHPRDEGIESDDAGREKPRLEDGYKIYINYEWHVHRAIGIVFLQFFGKLIPFLQDTSEVLLHADAHKFFAEANAVRQEHHFHVEYLARESSRLAAQLREPLTKPENRPIFDLIFEVRKKAYAVYEEFMATFSRLSGQLEAGTGSD